MTPQTLADEDTLVYPDTDGKPMAESTLQAQWIMRLFGNLDSVFAGRPDVFVAADLLWYPIRGNFVVTTAPDVMVAFGRPPGHRTSYVQHREGGVAPQVVFEVWSPSNKAEDKNEKDLFYETHGVTEYYDYDPVRFVFRARLRKRGVLRRERFATSFTSPLLGIRFEVSRGEPLRVFRPNGQLFRDYATIDAERQANADRADAAEARSRRMAEIVRRLRQGLATPDELAELDRLEAESTPEANP